MRLSRHDGPLSTLDVEQYSDDQGTLHVRCRCGGISRLYGNVSPNGRVSPLWACPYPGCDVIEFLELEGWQ